MARNAKSLGPALVLRVNDATTLRPLCAADAGEAIASLGGQHGGALDRRGSRLDDDVAGPRPPGPHDPARLGEPEHLPRDHRLAYRARPLGVSPDEYRPAAAADAAAAAADAASSSSVLSKSQDLSAPVMMPP